MKITFSSSPLGEGARMRKVARGILAEPLRAAAPDAPEPAATT